MGDRNEGLTLITRNIPSSSPSSSTSSTTSTPSPPSEPHSTTPFYYSTPNIQSLPYHKKYFDSVSFCNCAGPNQISYFNPKTREFYYHETPEHNFAGHAGEGFIFFPRKLPPTSEPGTHGSGDLSGHHGFHYYSGARYHGAKYFGPSSMESGIAEISFVILAFILWLYSFYRLYSVWQNTLNFSEASIQGPQGWDFLVNWILERVQLKRIKSIGKGRKCEPYTLEEGMGIELDPMPQSPQHPISIEIGGAFSSIIHEPMDETHAHTPVLYSFQAKEESGSLCVSEDLKMEIGYNQSIV